MSSRSSAWSTTLSQSTSPRASTRGPNTRSSTRTAVFLRSSTTPTEISRSGTCRVLEYARLHFDGSFTDQGVRRDPAVPRREVRPRTQGLLQEARRQDPPLAMALLPSIRPRVGPPPFPTQIAPRTPTDTCVHSPAPSPYYGQAFSFLSSADTLPGVLARYQNETVRVLGVLERVLAARRWLVGDKCSVADISFYTCAPRPSSPSPRPGLLLTTPCTGGTTSRSASSCAATTGSTCRRTSRPCTGMACSPPPRG